MASELFVLSRLPNDPRCGLADILAQMYALKMAFELFFQRVYRLFSVERSGYLDPKTSIGTGSTDCPTWYGAVVFGYFQCGDFHASSVPQPSAKSIPVQSKRHHYQNFTIVPFGPTARAVLAESNLTEFRFRFQCLVQVDCWNDLA
jgi:hypothetical protein